MVTRIWHYVNRPGCPTRGLQRSAVPLQSDSDGITRAGVKTMFQTKTLLHILNNHNVEAVLIGGLALRIYNSPRVTHDMALVVRGLDVDRVVELMHGNRYHFVTGLDERHAYVCLSGDEAGAWIEGARPSSLTFVGFDKPPSDRLVPLGDVDVTTQVDFLFDLSIPYARLRERAQTVRLDEVSFLVASPEDLLQLKLERKDKSPADRADIEFLRELLRQ